MFKKKKKKFSPGEIVWVWIKQDAPEPGLILEKTEYDTFQVLVGEQIVIVVPDRIWLHKEHCKKPPPQLNFPFVRSVFPNLIANEIVSVQPMTIPSGLLFYLDQQFKGKPEDSE